MEGIEDIVKEDTNNTVVQGNAESTSTPSPQGESKKSKKEEKESPKNDRSVEQFIRSLNSISNADEKISMACKKYIQLASENKRLQINSKQWDKRHAMFTKERDNLRLELNKTVLVKSKLENLCRELQKQNKAIKEESLLKIREEEERRKETQAKFQNTLSEITTLLQQNSEKNVKLRDDNINMGEKFKSVVQQYQLREQQVEKMSKQMSLESQLADAKLQKANLEMLAERERYTSEIEALKVKLAQYIAKIAELQGTETALRSQLAIYVEKYDEFQGALVKSNQVFVGFKEQMGLMTKQIKKLEKESQSYKERWQDSHAALVDLWGDRKATLEKFSATTRQLQHMQSLCRTFQAERTILLNTLKDHNIERPPVPAPIAEPPSPPIMSPSTANNAKVDAMVANCAQLRQSLAHLQTQLNVLTNNKNETKEEPAKSNKSKSKKSKGDKQISKSDLEKQEVKEIAKHNASSSIDSGVNHSVEETELEEVDPLSNIEPTVDSKISDNTMETLIQTISFLDLSSLDEPNIEVDKKMDLVKNMVSEIEEIKASGSENIMPSEQTQITDANTASSQQNQITDGNTVSSQQNQITDGNTVSSQQNQITDGNTVSSQQNQITDGNTVSSQQNQITDGNTESSQQIQIIDGNTELSLQNQIADGDKQISKSDLEKQEVKENAKDNANSSIDSEVNQSVEETELEVVDPLSNIEPTVDGKLSDNTVESLIQTISFIDLSSLDEPNIEVDKKMNLVKNMVFDIKEIKTSASENIMLSEQNQITDGKTASSQQKEVGTNSMTAGNVAVVPIDISETEKESVLNSP